ncbi:hypothetical protein BJX63DRAFT_390581 [Aspergillus granulosus]|uniref:Uncharacterized protein n=1 Tax=Aspergillus granulosus TaxID=176169 RepID=A0ABR4HJ08_9EURO
MDDCLFRAWCERQPVDKLKSIQGSGSSSLAAHRCLRIREEISRHNVRELDIHDEALEWMENNKALVDSGVMTHTLRAANASSRSILLNFSWWYSHSTVLKFWRC